LPDIDGIQKLVTLNDLERRNTSLLCVITLNVLAFKANCKLIKGSSIPSATKI